MSRRDTVIIAVLVNAVLLTLLFMLAVNIEEDRIPETTSTLAMTDSRSMNQSADLSPLPGTPINLATNNKSSSDELDLMLKDLALKTQMTESASVVTSSTPQEITLQEIPPSETQPPAQLTQIPATPTVVTTTSNQTAKVADFVEVTVKHGDYLEKIARENGTSISAIKKSNNLKSERINVGQVLKVPLSKKKKAASDESEHVSIVEAVTIDPQYYTILSGDNPWKIAKKFKVKFDDLLKLNNLDEEKARNLKPGDKLRVK